MKKALKVLGVLVVVGLLVGGWLFWRMVPKIPDRPFDRPSGRYAVGTKGFDWTDDSRPERYTRNPNDHRRILVQAWYPAIAATGAARAHYLERPKEFASRLGAWAARNTRTNAVPDAPVAPGDSGGFPVLVYNHGGAWTRWSATYSAEQMASHGYVVFAIEHFGFNQTTSYPDGTAFAADTLAFPKETGDDKKDALSSWAYLEDPVFQIWLGDAMFTLDQIERLNREPGPFQGRLDLTRIGAYGWSFGGALALELSAVDPRIKAAVDHDGQLFGTIRTRGTTRPVLQFHHGVDDALAYEEKKRPLVREMMALTDSWDSTAKAHSTAGWVTVTIAGTDHGDFSDLSLFYPRPKGMLDPKRAHEIINAYTLAFFDRYLKGIPSDLLTSPKSPYPEATVR
jgi:predicted dienelactone hydrolase